MNRIRHCVACHRRKNKMHNEILPSADFGRHTQPILLRAKKSYDFVGPVE